MALETERKFLLKNDAWRGLAPGVLYRQGYLSRRKECTVRVRLAGERAFLAVKGRNIKGRAHEYEYPIPVEDAEHMLAELAEPPVVEKIRHAIPYEGLVWEVDEFLGENKGLILAEVELASLDQPFARPDWVGEEVTGDPRYFNSSLAGKPYQRWSAGSGE